MRQARELIEQTDHSPEMKLELVSTYDKIMEAVSERCPQDKLGELGKTVAEAIIALAKVGQRDKDRLYAYALSQASTFLGSNGHPRR